MKKDSVKKADWNRRTEYDLSRLEGGVRGKYYADAAAAINVRLIQPELARIFPDSESVNRASRLLAETAGAAVPPSSRK